MSYFVSTIVNLNLEIIKTTLSGISKYPSSLLIYFFPIFLALALRKHNLRAIFLCNLFLGITGISWLAVLIWAYFERDNKPFKPPEKEADVCPHCKELVRFSASICCHCHQKIEKKTAPTEKK